MRKSFKKVTAILLAVMMLTSTIALSGAVTASAADASVAATDIMSGSSFQYGDFTCRYVSYSGGIEIEKCAETVVDAVVPASIEGYPIVTIGYRAFVDNTNLKSVTLPNTLTDIDSYAFQGCTSLESIEIPDSVEYIGYAAFENCTSLMNIKVPEGEVVYSTAVFDNTAWENSQPDGVIYLGNMLYKYKGEVPENTTIKIKNGTTKIATNAFAEISEYVNGSYVDIRNNDNIVAVEFPETLPSIGESAFANCDGLTKLVFPSSLEVIESSAFSGCKNIKEIEWSKNLKKIDGYVFSNCTSLESVKLPDGVTSIGYAAFKGCESLKTFEMPDSVTEVSPEMFMNCYALESVRMSDSLTYVHGYTFENCSNLKKVNIPKNAETIRVWAFSNCESLEEIVLPDTLKTIEDGAFRGCGKLANINIPESVEEIGVYAFVDTAWYNSLPDGIVYINNVLYACKGTIEDEVITIKDGTTYITEDAFSYNKYAKKIIIPDSVTYIGEEAFYYCEALEEVKLSKNTPVIPYYGFAHCTSLKSVVLPEGVTKLDYSCFTYCESLESIYLPKSLAEVYYFIDPYYALSDVYYAGSEEDLNSIRYYTGNMDELKSKDTITFHYNYSVEQPTEAPTTPSNPNVQTITGEARLVDADITWGAVEGATKYWIYKAWEEDGPFYCYDATTETSYTVRRLQAATDYYFKVVTVTEKDGNLVLSKLADAPTLHLKTQEAEKITVKIDNVDKTSISFSWPEFENAQRYWIKFSNTTKHTNLKDEWVTYTSVDPSVTSYTINGRKPNTPYYITIEVEYPDPQTGKEFANYISADTKTWYSNENFFTFKKQSNGGLVVSWPEDVNSSKSWMYVYDKNGKLVVSNASTTNSMSFSFAYDWESCTFALKTMDADSTGRLITPELGWAYK